MLLSLQSPHHPSGCGKDPSHELYAGFEIRLWKALTHDRKLTECEWLLEHKRPHWSAENCIIYRPLFIASWSAYTSCWNRCFAAAFRAVDLSCTWNCWQTSGGRRKHGVRATGLAWNVMFSEIQDGNGKKEKYQENTSTRCNNAHTRWCPLLLAVDLWPGFESETKCVLHHTQNNAARIKQCCKTACSVVVFSVLSILRFTDKLSCSILKTAASQQGNGQFKGLDSLINFKGLPPAIHPQLLGHSLCLGSLLFQKKKTLFFTSESNQSSEFAKKKITQRSNHFAF